MKKIVLFNLFFLSFSIALAQNINFPDNIFKGYLVNDAAINTNRDEEISVEEAKAFSGTISLVSRSIRDITGIEYFVNLTGLILFDNDLVSIDLSKNIELTHLRTSHNPLGSIDISANIKLIEFHCTYNQLVSLNLNNGNNDNFQSLSTLFNPNLRCIKVDDFSYSQSNWRNNPNFNIGTTTAFSENCDLNPIYMPDDNFKNYILSNTSINTNEDQEISYAEAKAFTGEIDCSNKSITDLSGLEAFTALTKLNCSNNSVENLDLSLNTSLTDVYLQNNQLKTLNLANGNNATIVNFDARNNTELTCIQVDDITYSMNNWTNIDSSATFSLDCKATAGLEGFVTENTTLYPNPASTIVHVTTKNTIDIKEIRVFSPLGKMVLQSTSKILNTQNLSQGVYLVKIISDKGFGSKKLIIQ